MKLALSREEESFAEETRTWLNEHLVGEFADHRGAGGPADDDAWDVRIAWERELAAGGWLGISWPAEYGGTWRDAAPGDHLRARGRPA